MNKSAPAFFVAGLLVLASIAVAVSFYDHAQRIEAARATDAERIEALEAELRLAQAEVSEYKEKLDEARRIADDIVQEREAKERLALEHAARIEQLEAEIKALRVSATPEDPAGVLLAEDMTSPITTPVEDHAANVDALDEIPSSNDPASTVEPSVVLAEDVTSADEEAPSVAEADAAQPTVEPERRDLERELEELRAEKRAYEERLAAATGGRSNGVPIGEVAVTTGLKLKGKVLLVNTRYDFVVVDLGARDGVEKGMVLILHRGKTFIGKCQIARVYEQKAAADLMRDWMKDPVLVGDGVRKF